MPQASVLRRNNVNVTGSGKRAIVFAHGFGCDQTCGRLSPGTSSGDFRVVLFDYVGARAIGSQRLFRGSIPA